MVFFYRDVQVTTPQEKPAALLKRTAYKKEIYPYVFDQVAERQTFAAFIAGTKVIYVL